MDGRFFNIIVEVVHEQLFTHVDNSRHGQDLLASRTHRGLHLDHCLADLSQLVAKMIRDA